MTGLHQLGAKDDAGKLPLFSLMWAYFPHALEEVARVSAYGAKKYTPDGWRSVPNGVSRYTNALVRHLAAEAKGKVVNHEDGDVLYATQVAWNALARLELMVCEGPFDDAKALEHVG